MFVQVTIAKDYFSSILFQSNLSMNNFYWMKGSREQTEGQGSYSGPLCHEQTLLATRTPLIMLKLMAYKVKTLYLGILLSSSGTTCRSLPHSHIPLSKIFLCYFQPCGPTFGPWFSTSSGSWATPTCAGKTRFRTQHLQRTIPSE